VIELTVKVLSNLVVGDSLFAEYFDRVRVVAFRRGAVSGRNVTALQFSVTEQVKFVGGD
jgi:hypothetical protein